MRSTTCRLLAGACCAALLTFLSAPDAGAGLIESWESQAAQNPFAGTGDLTWTGDVVAWAITTATWPTAPAQDFAGLRSLRSSNHRSVNGGASVVETILTNVSGAVDFSKPIEWNVFFSGNSATITTSRRADFILLADTSTPSIVEDPNDLLNGYKLTLSDPLFDATSNEPPSSHDGAALADSLTLWRVDESDDRWRVVGSIPLVGNDDYREGWNLRARRDADGAWSIGFAGGAIGQIPALTSIGIDLGGPNVSSFAGNVYAGVGWLAPNNTTNDHTDFGFDNFSVAAVPEPSALGLGLGAFAGLVLASLAKRR